ncbi:VRR-NUC domain-containing protein [Streptomyces sp. NPDC088141]|uniref:VRR-NUC domain-containing protein n=1 Tax=unclassified Streptomyces TaxID=2593676 RepID=UPI003427FA35
MARTPEGTIEDYLLAQCRASGFLCLKFVSPARGGVPDRIIVTPGGTVFVEVKKPGGELEKRQRVVHAKMRRFGARIHVVDDKPSVDSFIAHLLASPSDQQRAAS